MRRVLSFALGAAAMAAATPASAAVVVVASQAGVPLCSAFTFAQNETACAGGFQGNFLTSSPITGAGLADLQALGYTGDGSYLTPKLGPLGGAAVLDFGQTLYGLTIIGLHYGAAGAAPEATSFFLFDLGTTGASSITITGRTGANSLGTSDAVLFQTGRAVPEPATWALMLLGFGGIGMALRRSRKANGRLLQIA